MADWRDLTTDETKAAGLRFVPWDYRHPVSLVLTCPCGNEVEPNNAEPSSSYVGRCDPIVLFVPDSHWEIHDPGCGREYRLRLEVKD